MPNNQKPSSDDPTKKPSNVTPITDKALAEAIDQDPSAQRQAKRGALTERLVHLIETSDKLALGLNGGLCRYKDGVYERLPESWVGNTLRKYLDRPGVGIRQLSGYLIREVDTILKTGKSELLPSPPERRINIVNGNFDPTKVKLTPHSPDYLSTVRIPITFDPKATCPHWDYYISKWFPLDCVDLAWEVIGNCMVSDRIVQQAIWLEGSGGNGKSTFIMAVQGLIGKENTVNLPVKDTFNNQFVGAEIFGKLLMFDLDATVEQFEEASLLKKIIAGDEIRAERKHGHGFYFRPFCKVILSGNRSPRSRDSSYGYLRRMVLVPFEGIFDKIERQDDILAKLLSEGEKSGALLKAASGFMRLRARGKFDEPPTVKEATEEFREEADPIAQFFLACIDITDPESAVSKKDLVSAYNDWAKDNMRRSMDGRGVGQWISRNLPQVKTQRPRNDSPDRLRTYQGIKLK